MDSSVSAAEGRRSTLQKCDLMICLHKVAPHGNSGGKSKCKCTLMIVDGVPTYVKELQWSHCTSDVLRACPLRGCMHLRILQHAKWESAARVSACIDTRKLQVAICNCTS